jgi:membrane fusion protein (multidrug efflux system)
MNKKVKWGIYAVIGIGLIGMAIHSFLPKSNPDLAGPQQAPSARRKALNVIGETVKVGTINDEIPPTVGLLIPDEEVSLSFETSGKVTAINFTEGTHVKKGQLLAKVNDAQLQAQLRRLEAQLQLAEDRVFRQNALLEKEAVSKEAYEQVQTDLAMLRAEIDMVKANIALTELRAPFDGIVGLRQVSEGTYATPSTIVATLTKISPLKIEFAVPERYTGIIKDGARMQFTVEGHLEPFQATVYATESHIDSKTHTFSMRARYANTDGKLLPGRFANISLLAREIPNSISIPSEAIVPEMGVDKVFLYKSGKAQPVSITKGIRTESRVQVLQGLTPGDTIITSGTLQLRTGLSVTLDEVK